jgi:hypothetical protein
MWCKVCRQDVPALASEDKQSFCCPRCGEAVCADPQHSRTPRSARGKSPKSIRPSQAAKKAASEPIASFHKIADEPLYDGWELDEQLRHIERILQGSAARRSVTRFDEAHAARSEWHVPATEHLTQASSKRGRLGVSILAWSLLVPGATAFVFGGVLLAWSLLTGRQDLWNIGLPAAIAGQVALVLGLAIQIERLFLQHRDTTAKIDNVGRQLHELVATALAGVGQHASSTAFYSHFADGAGPRLLLADLKSQLDLLALKLAESESV